MFDDDIPKYKKRAKHAPAMKSNHAHSYSYCVFEYPDNAMCRSNDSYCSTRFTIGKFCTVCGKISETFCSDPKYTDHSARLIRGCAVGRIWNSEACKEFDPKTRTLPTYFLDNAYTQKYVKFEVTR